VLPDRVAHGQTHGVDAGAHVGPDGVLDIGIDSIVAIEVPLPLRRARGLVCEAHDQRQASRGRRRREVRDGHRIHRDQRLLGQRAPAGIGRVGNGQRHIVLHGLVLPGVDVLGVLQGRVDRIVAIEVPGPTRNAAWIGRRRAVRKLHGQRRYARGLVDAKSRPQRVVGNNRDLHDCRDRHLERAERRLGIIEAVAARRRTPGRDRIEHRRARPGPVAGERNVDQQILALARVIAECRAKRDIDIPDTWRSVASRRRGLDRDVAGVDVESVGAVIIREVARQLQVVHRRRREIDADSGVRNASPAELARAIRAPTQTLDAHRTAVLEMARVVAVLDTVPTCRIAIPRERRRRRALCSADLRRDDVARLRLGRAQAEAGDEGAEHGAAEETHERFLRRMLRAAARRRSKVASYARPGRTGIRPFPETTRSLSGAAQP
jgi:hypothetical protein